MCDDKCNVNRNKKFRKWKWEDDSMMYLYVIFTQQYLIKIFGLKF